MSASHEMEIRVRYSETDSMSLLHHGNYFDYFEMGRTELFRAQGGNYRELEEKGYFLVVSKIECRYRRPARYDDVLTLRTTLAKVTGAKLEHDYELFRDGVSIAVAHSVIACVNREGEIQRMPAAMELLGTEEE